MSWWERNHADEPGPIRRAVRSIYEGPERLQPVDDRRETAYRMDVKTGEIWLKGEARPQVDDLDELDWTELGGIDRETGNANVDYGEATRWAPISEVLRRRWRR